MCYSVKYLIKDLGNTVGELRRVYEKFDSRVANQCRRLHDLHNIGSVLLIVVPDIYSTEVSSFSGLAGYN